MKAAVTKAIPATMAIIVQPLWKGASGSADRVLPITASSAATPSTVPNWRAAASVALPTASTAGVRVDDTAVERLVMMRPTPEPVSS